MTHYDTRNRTIKFNCFLEIIPVITLVPRKPYDINFYQSPNIYLP